MSPKPKYRRSWKNFLLDDEYQLSFTFVLVAVAAVIAIGLGLVIKAEVRKATTIAISDVEGRVDEGLVDEVQGKNSIAHLESWRRRVNYALVGLDLVLLVGLFVYGIRMTHRVAGPLHKLGGYLDKVKAGRFETVYPLRKGDQLVEFYDHFRRTHDALRAVQASDVERLRVVVAAAEKADFASRSPEAAQALDELRRTLKSKEAGLV